MTTKAYVERRDSALRVIERVGPFTIGGILLRDAVAMQMHIASLHNASRRPSDESFQLVYEVTEDAT